MKRIGLFGGTFNPIHYGHLRPALEVMEGFGLDKLYLIPAAIPPHKREAAAPRDRLQMARIAASACAGFEVSDVELRRSGPSYTVDTLRYFKSALPSDHQSYFIVGADAFLDIHSWRSYLKLLELVPFIIMDRPGYSQDNRERVQGYLDEHIGLAYRFSPDQGGFFHPRYQALFPFETSLLDISATRIRERVRQGRSIKFLLPERVECYIKTRGLYKA